MPVTPSMTPIALIEAIATLLWVYSALTFVAWVLRVRALPKGAHVATAAELAFHVLPAMIGLVAVVLIGALIGLPSVVAFIAILFPAGTAYGTHMALTELRDAPTGRKDLPRVAAAFAIAAALIVLRSGS